MDLKVYVANAPTGMMDYDTLYSKLSGVGIHLHGDWNPYRTIRIVNDALDQKNEETARQDLKCISNCDVMIAFMFSADLCTPDVYIRIGAALGFGKRVLVYYLYHAPSFSYNPLLLNHPMIQTKGCLLPLNSNEENLNRFIDSIKNSL